MAETFRREKRLGLSEDEELFGYIHITFPDLNGLLYGTMKAFIQHQQGRRFLYTSWHRFLYFVQLGTRRNSESFRA